MAKASDAQLDDLLAESLVTARAVLGAHGGFPPFAHYCDDAGRIVLLQFSSEEQGGEISLTVDSLQDVLRQMATEQGILACAITSDVPMVYETGESMTAIVTQVCSVDFAVDYVTPYEWRKAGLFGRKHKVDLFEPTGNPIDNPVF